MVAAPSLFEVLLEKYSEDQPRDEAGRFASTGGREAFDAYALAKSGVYPEALEGRFHSLLYHQYLANGGTEVVSSPERQALRDYKGMGYAALNDNLRHAPLTPLQARDMNLIDTAISRATIPENVTLFRGGNEAFRAELEKMSVGDSFRDAGFVSTSTDPSHAALFAKAYSGNQWPSPEEQKSESGGVFLRLAVDAGTPALTLISEDEVLLGRGHTFTITKMQSMNRTTTETSGRPAQKNGAILVVDVSVK